MIEPLNLPLNCAVHTLASRLFPAGYDVAPDAPNTLKKLNRHIKATGRMLVSSLASDQTIFADPETNYAFRAWHDWAHWRYSLPMTFTGEVAAAYVQAAHLVRLYGDDGDVPEMVALLLAEVIGQAAHYERTGVFPADQMAFTLATVDDYRDEAAALVAALADTGGDRDALELAAFRSRITSGEMLSPREMLALKGYLA